MARYITQSRRARERKETEARRMAETRRLMVERQHMLQPGTSAASRPRRNPNLEINRADIIRQRQRELAEEDKDRFYVVEKLVDKRINAQGEEEYLVRWQNYPPEDDSWEPRCELETNVTDMLNEFNRVGRESDSPTDLHCICKRPYKFEEGGMIECYTCKTWYHFKCLNMNIYEANCYDRFHCCECRKANPRLKNVIKKEKVNKLKDKTKIKVDEESGIVI